MNPDQLRALARERTTVTLGLPKWLRAEITVAARLDMRPLSKWLSYYIRGYVAAILQREPVHLSDEEVRRRLSD